MNYNYKLVSPTKISLLKDMLAVFGNAFEDIPTYTHAVPSDAYLTALLSKPHVTVLAALHDEKVIGGLVAYELEKFEQERKEIYIYDLAVSVEHRRKGVATGLINELKRIAKERGAYVLFVQADHGDTPAIELYKSLGIQEDVYHFDIAVE